MTPYILIGIYIASVISVGHYFKIAYSKNGRWYNLKYSITDFIITVTPFFNILALLIGWIEFNPHHKPFKTKFP